MQIAGQMSSSENPSAHFLLAAEKSENSEESSLTAAFKASCPRGMLVLVDRPAKIKQFKMATIETFPGDDALRPAFIAGIKTCDVIMHKVYLHPDYIYS